MWTFLGLLLISRKRELNFFQQSSLCLLAMGVILRVLLLSLDFIHLSNSGGKAILDHNESDHVEQDFMIAFFIRMPNIFFAVPLFAISMDWVELCVLLRSTQEWTDLRYEKMSEKLQSIFKWVTGIVLLAIVINLFAFVVTVHLTKEKSEVERRMYDHSID